MGDLSSFNPNRLPPDPALAGQLVEARFGMSTELVNEYDSESTSALDELASWDFSVPLENLDLGFGNVSPPNIGDAPIPDPVAPYESDMQPVEFPDISALRGLLDLSDVILSPTAIPTLEAQPPTVNIGDAPDDAIPDIPNDVPTISDIPLPTSPDITLPAEPVLEDIILPAIPEIESLSFEGTLPTADLTPPEPMFVYADVTYQSDLADAIKTKLYNDVVNGGTGLDPTVEQDMWDRAISRLNVEEAKAYQQALNNWASWNNDMPDGIIAGSLQEVLADSNRNKLDLDRDIAYKQADLAQNNTQFAITSGLVNEKQLMDFTNQINNRAFEVARARVQAVIDAFNIRVSAFSAQLEGYKASAQVFESRIRAEISKVEIYRAQMEGAKIHGELQSLKVDIYTQKVRAIQTLIDLYVAQLEGVKTQLAVDDSKVKVFRARLDAVIAQIQGVTAKYNLYQSTIAGEAAKVDLYGNQVSAFSSEVQAAKTAADINLNEMQALVEGNKDKMALLASATTLYQADTQYEIGKEDVNAKVYTAQIGGYSSEVKRETDYLKSKVDSYRAQIGEIASEAELAIKEMDANLRAATALKEIQVEALKATANIQAQKVASALTSVSASAQIGFNGSLADSYSNTRSYIATDRNSYDTGYRWNYNYNYSG